MAEDILRIAENSEQDSQFASEWIEYARWVLPGFGSDVDRSPLLGIGLTRRHVDQSQVGANEARYQLSAVM